MDFQVSGKLIIGIEAATRASFVGLPLSKTLLKINIA
jgi:hypothetical protein